MKTKELEFDVDFIGEQTSLTTEEERALNDYFKHKKASLKIAEAIKPSRKNRSKSVVK